MFNSLNFIWLSLVDWLKSDDQPQAQVAHGYVLWHTSMEAYLAPGLPSPSFVTDINRAWFVNTADEVEAPPGYVKRRAQQLTLIHILEG